MKRSAIREPAAHTPHRCDKERHTPASPVMSRHHPQTPDSVSLHPGYLPPRPFQANESHATTQMPNVARMKRSAIREHPAICPAIRQRTAHTILAGDATTSPATPDSVSLV